MDLRHLRSFIAVYDAGGFRAAAEDEHLTQSAVSRQVAALEQDLGVSLFVRTPAGARPTRAGELFHAEVAAPLRALLRSLDQARTTARAHVELQIGYIPPAIRGPLPSLVQRMRTAWPDAVIGLRELTSTEVVAAVRSGEVDVGFFVPEDHHPDLVVAPMVRLDYRILVSSDDDLCAHDQVRLSDLDGRVLITPGGAEPVHSRMITFIRSHAPGLRTQTALRFHEVQGLVAAGIGVAAVPPISAADIPAGLALIPTVPALPSAVLAIAVRRGWRSPAAEVVARFRQSWRPNADRDADDEVKAGGRTANRPRAFF